MDDLIKLDLNDLEMEKNEIIRVYKNQLDNYSQIKKTVERLTWDDDRYDELIQSLNQIAHALMEGLNALTNGNDVYIIDDLSYWAKKYLENAKKFPNC